MKNISKVRPLTSNDFIQKKVKIITVLRSTLILRRRSTLK